MKIGNIIFDLDGTLLNTAPGIIESVKHTIRAVGYQELSDEELLTFVGPPIQNSFMKMYACSSVEAQNAANVFRKHYRTKALLKAEPYNGIYNLCHKLRSENRKLAVATYKREDYAISLLKHFGFDQYFDSIHGADNENILTKADIIDICLKELRASKENTVLIGDTVHDAEGAKRMEIGFLAVTYGFGFKPKTLIEFQCLGVADNVSEIYKIIRKCER